MSDLEDEEHDNCHHYLLTIVARGAAIITEIYRLVELLPEPFKSKDRHKNPTYIHNQGKCGLKDITFDFSYFKNAEAIEAKIELDADLKNFDEKFCDDYGEVLTRFYQTFEAIQRHTTDLNNFTADLGNGLYIGQSLDELLADHENRQLICEAYYQIGCMLLLTDKSFEGQLRERLIVSYYRYSAFKSSPDANLDETCNLMRTTDFRCEQQQTGPTELGDNADRAKRERRQTYRPPGYPENYLLRAGCDQSVISSLIAKLQAIDIYNQTVTVFPNPDHRSNALAQQTAILYVLLYFCPDILRSQKSRMREIADKFFPDNWVAHVFINESVNLIEMWEPYQAARESLLQIHDLESVRKLSSQMSLRFDRNNKQLLEYLKEGWLNEETFVEHSGRILNCIRDSNVTLKWLLLHSKAQPWLTDRLARALSAEVLSYRPEPRRLCEFFYSLCVFENKVALLYDKAYKIRMTKMREQKSRAIDMLEELICIFNDTKPMRWVKVGVNHGLAKILSEAKSQLEELNLDQVTSSNREAFVRLVNRIESARNSFSAGKSLQVVQLFVDTKDQLVKLLRYLDLDSNFKTILQSVGDFAYGWSIVDEVFTEPVQAIIKDNPENLYTYEAVIIKLTSALESQLVRLQQVGAQADLISVSQYYSSKLISHIKNVLQIIPAEIFELIRNIVSIRASNNKHPISAIPSRINLDQLKQYTLIDQRADILQITSVISHYARGIMAMPKTPIGLVRVDSKKMFEEGLKRELATNISNQIIDILASRTAVITASPTPLQLSKDLIHRLERLESVLTSYKQSLEYVQDFLFIYGIKMWRCELSRIVRESVQQAVAALSISKYSRPETPGPFADNRSTRASTIKERFSTITAAKIRTAFLGQPGLVQSDQDPNEFIFVLALLQDILKITNPLETVYDEQAGVWYDKLHHQQVLEPTTIFKLIGTSLGVPGLNGLDELCSTMIMQELDQLNSIISGISHTTQLRQSGSNNSLSLVDVLEVLNQVRHDKWLLAEIDSEATLKQLMLSIIIGFLSSNRTLSSSHTNIEQRFVNHLLVVGQLQIIRMNIQCVLSTSCRFEAKHLYGCLEGLNSALLATIRQGKGSPIQQKAGLAFGRSRTSLDQFSSVRPDEDKTPNETNAISSSDKLDESQLIFELANHLEWVGMSDPISKVYTLSLNRTLSITNDQQLMIGEAVGTTRSQSYKNRRAIYYSILEHSSRLGCSHSTVKGALPTPRRSSFDKPQNKADEQPLYFGIITLLNHFETNLTA